MILKKQHEYLILIVLILGFIGINFFKINLPYIWDEMACYVATARHLSENGLSLLPNAAPPNLTFGHPLFPQNVIALSIKFFGDNLFAVHGAVLILTVFFIFVFYIFLRKYFPFQLVLIGLIWLILQPVFLSQSVLFQLEMFLTLFFVLSFKYYLEKKWFWYVFTSFLGMMTKETFLIFPLACFVHHLYFSVLEQTHILQNYLIIVSPYLFFIVFIFLQKYYHNFYLSEVNVGKAAFNWYSFKQRWKYNTDFIFVLQGRRYFSYVLLLFFVLYIYKTKKILSFFKNKMVVFVLILLFGYLVFASINNPLERYTLVIFPFLVIFSLSILNQIENNKLVYLLLIPTIISIYYIDNKTRFTDSDNGYVYHAQNNKQIIKYIEDKNLNTFKIRAGWPLVFNLTNPKNGTTTKEFQNVKLIEPNEDTMKCYYIFTNPGNIDDTLNYKNRLIKVNEINLFYSKSIVYENNVK